LPRARKKEKQQRKARNKRIVIIIIKDHEYITTKNKLMIVKRSKFNLIDFPHLKRSQTKNSRIKARKWKLANLSKKIET
jgi:hypothetical protein